MRQILSSCKPYFNPRSLAGATILCFGWFPSDVHFNPRSLAGATKSCLSKIVNNMVFQSTLPRGSDKKRRRALRLAEDFNPRSLAGATLRLLKIGKEIFIFQSTLPRGSDIPQPQVNCRIKLISIHAPSRERQCKEYFSEAVKAHFNPRSLAGATIGGGAVLTT